MENLEGLEEKEPQKAAEGQSEPRQEAEEQSEPRQEAKEQSEPRQETEEQSEPQKAAKEQSEPRQEAEKQSEPQQEAEGQSEPQKAAEEQSEPKEEDESLQILKPYLDERVLRAIEEMGFEKMTPIQVQTIPVLLEGRDVIGQAQTGTGKTAAFGIPILQKIDPDNKALQAIILCPTRELAMQAAEELRRLAKYMKGIKVLPVYGGQEISRQITGLKGTQIVVGTPGRVMDHMRRHTLKLDDVKIVILDEADEMLDMGFREDMELILGEIPGEHQTALFSATMPRPILDITDKFQKDAKFIHVASKELTIPLVSQHYYHIRNKDKDAACIRILEYYQPRLCLIFCNTKIKVDELAECLKRHGFAAEALHGDMSQAQRDAAMGRFRNGGIHILIATDVAARGIDVENVEAVINYDVPQDIEYYVHRIGRTGRAGKTGSSYTLVSGKEVFRIRQIERFCRTTIDEWRLPNAAKVLKAKAEKILSDAWELHESEDMGLMRKYISRKMEQESCEAMDIAAVLLKYYVGDKGEEIEVEEDLPGRKRDEEQRGRRRRGEGSRSENEGRDRRRSEEESRDRRRSEDESSRDRRRGEGSGGENESRDRRRSEDESRDRRRGENESRDRRRGEDESRDRRRGEDEGRNRRRGEGSGGEDEGRNRRRGEGSGGENEGRDRRRSEEESRDRKRSEDESSRDRRRSEEESRDRRRGEDFRRKEEKSLEGDVSRRKDKGSWEEEKSYAGRNRAERRLLAGITKERKEDEDYRRAKKGKVEERNSNDGWWNNKKLPFSTRERKYKR